jgi:hypothetical protein
MAKVKPLAETRKFKYDWREINPKLHLLYVKNAVEHLSIANAAVKKLLACSNIHSTAIAVAMLKEISKLTRDNAAWADAEEIISSTKVRFK